MDNSRSTALYSARKALTEEGIKVCERGSIDAIEMDLIMSKFRYLINNPDKVSQEVKDKIPEFINTLNRILMHVEKAEKEALLNSRDF